ncbi:MAG: hypothetical protein ACI8SR_002920, partial [Oceanicoccus sp.]
FESLFQTDYKSFKTYFFFQNQQFSFDVNIVLPC